MIRKLIKRLAYTAAIVGAVYGVVRYLSRRSTIIQTAEDEAARALRYEAGKLQGEVYEVTGGRPDPNAPDDVIADRIRSELGPLERRLDIPRVHVMVNDHVADLVGVVRSTADVAEIESRIVEISGVDGVVSHLHVGLGAGDSTPSEGRATKAPSAAKKAISQAAKSAPGISDDQADNVARLVLSRFFERLPKGERDQALGHLPHDVLELLEPPRRSGVTKSLTNVDQLASGVAVITGIDGDTSKTAVLAILGALKGVVADESDHIAAVLPRDLKATWESIAIKPKRSESKPKAEKGTAGKTKAAPKATQKKSSTKSKSESDFKATEKS